MLRNIFLFSLGSTSGFLASNYLLQQDIYSSSAVLNDRLSDIHSQLSNITTESRLVESRSKEVSRELDILKESKNKELEEAKRELSAQLKQQAERQERINGWIVEQMQKQDKKIDVIAAAVEKENPGILQSVHQEQQAQQEEDGL